MESTLKTIQVFAKIGKVLSKIVFIFCIIGVVGCGIGMVTLGIGMTEAFKIGGVTIHSIIEKAPGVNVGTAYNAMIGGFILCVGEIILAKNAIKYFDNELRAGTPFTLDGAKEMLQLGIYTICIPLASNVIAHIVCSILEKQFTKVGSVELSNTVSVGLGVGFIVVSFICKYGAELREA